MAIEPCGFCSGSGIVYGSMYDRFGYKIYDEPPKRVCEYCDGSGYTELGSTLLPAESREEIIRRQEG